MITDKVLVIFKNKIPTALSGKTAAICEHYMKVDTCTSKNYMNKIQKYKPNVLIFTEGTTSLWEPNKILKYLPPASVIHVMAD